MSAAFELHGEVRNGSGTGTARALRRDGKIPAVVYGKGFEPVNVAISLREISKVVSKRGFKTKPIELQVGSEKHNVFAKDVQLHPVSDVPLHVDFIKVQKDKPIVIEVPVVFINADKSPGLKRGGALNVVRHEVELLCLPDNIPAKITLDLNGARIGKSFHISHVTLPEGVKPAITDRDFTIATIAGRGGKDTSEAEGTESGEAAA
jgi:large subunit ribosomal protein L25